MPASHQNIEKKLEKKLWASADELRANSRLRPSEYSVPVLGLIFLRYADHKFTLRQKKLAAAANGRHTFDKTDYQAHGVLYLPDRARFASLLKLPRDADTGQAINKAMRAIEAENKELKDVLPKTYHRLDNHTLSALLQNLATVSMNIEGDAFGRVYEYFLGKFAMSEGQKGGEFFTPTAIVKLIVEIIEPYHGRIFDPACGSGGMFVQSARFVEKHQKNPQAEITLYGQEKVVETLRLCRLNLAVQGLSGDIRQGNTYYEDSHRSEGRFDFVMANPPFNVDRVEKERLKDDPRFPFGLPKTDNANYLWIQLVYSALNATGRAGFVMANSAGDARGVELEIRRKLIETRAVDAVVALGPNFFYTVTLPCTLWFLDKGKAINSLRGARSGQVLFLDARHIYNQVDRAHRDLTPEQIEFLANVVRLYRSQDPETVNGSEALIKEYFPKSQYADVPGLCKVVTLAEIAAQDFSLNPGRYVGRAERTGKNFVFADRLAELNNELDTLNAEARELEERIGKNMAQLLKRAVPCLPSAESPSKNL